MDSQLKFAVIGFKSLEAIALKRILADDIGARADSFKSMEQFIPAAERYDAFVVTPSVALLNPDFFLTRRQRVAVAVDFASSSESQMLSFSTDADEQEIVATLRMLMKAARDESPAQGALSSREIDVLKEVASGKTNKEIADTLCISINTVITHRRNVSAKLGIRSASGLSLYAMMNGLI